MSNNPHQQRFHHDEDLEQGGVRSHSSGVELSKTALLWALQATGLGLWLQTYHSRSPAITLFSHFQRYTELPLFLLGFALVAFLGAMFLVNTDFLDCAWPRCTAACYVCLWYHRLTMHEKRAIKLLFQSIVLLYMASYGIGDLLDNLGQHLGLL
jgi:hypothetical protein